MSVLGFWMDETEITNNEYRQFVAYVIDSIARMKLYEDDDIKEKIVPSADKNGGGKLVAELFKKPNPEDEDAEDYDPNAPEVPFINHDEAMDWEQKELHKLLYSEMYYQGEERFRGKRQIDVSKLKYHYQWFDLVLAATSDKNRDKYKPQNRKDFIKDEDVLIYPDTLCWIRDFTYSFNEPMARVYFWHPRYDDYPVVGVNWAQARAFCHWRSYQKDAYWEMNDHMPNTEMFRLPTEYEWEYASRGGRIGNKYPWGGPYARNGKGCMLANFKPMRGDYGASDGGVYPVRADSYFPNDFGLYNMSGNVAEWTSSYYSDANYDLMADLSPDVKVEAGDNDPVPMKKKVIRGGSWKDVGSALQVSARAFEYQDTAKSYVGFRCVMSYMGRSIGDE
jgi:gliding motility-associated lipoprotein GldK